jgi:hypothetical protein
LDNLIAEGSSRIGSDSLVFNIPDGFLWVSDQFETQCVAITKMGERCRNRVFDQGQIWAYDAALITYLDEPWRGRLLTQCCKVHDEVQAERHLPVEWVFKPRGAIDDSE